MKLLFNAMAMLLLVASTTVSTGCKKKNDSKGCEGFTAVSGSVEVNGEEMLLVVAQSIINAFGGEDTYLMQFMAIQDDCNTTHSVSYNISIPSGSSLNGVYPFKDFFNAGSGDAVGDYVLQVLEPTSQSSKSIIGGSLTVNNKGGGNYEFEINGNLVGGGTIHMKVSAKL